MRKVFFAIIVTGVMMFGAASAASRVYCSQTCGTYESSSSSSFCDTVARWCVKSTEIGTGSYVYCIPDGGLYLATNQDSENIPSSRWIICFSTQSDCNSVRSQLLSWSSSSSSGVVNPPRGYFFSCARAGVGGYSTSDEYQDIYACAPGYYPASRNVQAINSDSASGLGCTKCRAGTASAGVAISCTTCSAGTYSATTGASSCTKCPSAMNIYTDVAKTTLATGTSSAGATAQSSCYLPAGTYYDAMGTFVIETSMCTY